MTRYRIIQRPGIVHPKVPIFAVEEKFLLRWKELNCFVSIEQAKRFIEEIIETKKKPAVITQVVSEYDCQ